MNAESKWIKKASALEGVAVELAFRQEEEAPF